jgi:hypothetical protein
VAHFTRTRPAPKVKGAGYAKFRPFVRLDFTECCAYCLLPELWRAGEKNFELDHFRPQSRPEFKHLINNFYNLYYSCHVCNRNKWNTWPPPEYLAKGIGFVDFCRDNFSDHFRLLPDGRWEPLTASARYTEQILLLNDPHLVRLRFILARIEEHLPAM